MKMRFHKRERERERERSQPLASNLKKFAQFFFLLSTITSSHLLFNIENNYIKKKLKKKNLIEVSLVKNENAFS